MPALIEIRDVTKRYESSPQPALDTVSLGIEAGQITALMGPSGCGKSTLLNLIGGLDRPTQGQIHLDGVRVDRLSEGAAARFRRTKVGFIFQFFQLIDDLSVRDNVAVAAELAGVPRRDAHARANDLLQQLGLADRGDRYPVKLSGGERQRLAIARAVVNNPVVLLADEPTGALDTRNGESVLALLEDLNRRGQTILLVTHDEHLAAQRADRIVRLVDGAVAADTAEEQGRLMGAVGTVTWAGLRRRRLQAAVIGLVLFLASAAATLALATLVESQQPFETAFAAANGAHLVIDFDGTTTPAALRETTTASSVTDSAGPWPIGQAGLFIPGEKGGAFVNVQVSGRANPSTSVDRVTLSAGRWWQSPGEVVISARGSGTFKFDVGQTITLQEELAPQGEKSSSGAPTPSPSSQPNLPTHTYTIVGIASSISTPTTSAWMSPPEISRR